MQSGRLVNTSRSYTTSAGSPGPVRVRPSRGTPAAVRRRPIDPGSSLTATYSESQAWLNLIGGPWRARAGSCGELGQEALVVLVEQPDVLDAVLEHRDPFDPEAEGEAGDLRRIVADLLEDRRMHHSRAAE